LNKIEFLNSLGFTPISKDLNNDLEVKCKEGHIFKRTFASFKQGYTSCPICEKEEKTRFLNSLGFTPISKDLGMNLEIKCENGHTFKRPFNSFKLGHTNCPICEKEEKIRFLNSLGFTLVSKNLSINLEVICEKGHTFKRAYGSFKNGITSCPICEKEEKIEFLNNLGFTPISENLGDKLEVKCEKGHVFKRRFNHFKEGATNCPICEREEKIKFLNNLGFISISKDLSVNLEVKCKKGHIFKRKFDIFKNGFDKCPECEREEKIEFLNSLGFTLVLETLGGDIKVKCKKGHVFERRFNSFKDGTY
jgi:hypothetical protein